MANEEHVAILKKGVKAWNEWREKNPEIRPDLESADIGSRWLEIDDSIDELFRTHLRPVTMGHKAGRAFIGTADLRAVNFQNAILDNSNLADADLREADLRAYPKNRVVISMHAN